MRTVKSGIKSHACGNAPQAAFSLCLTEIAMSQALVEHPDIDMLLRSTIPERRACVADERDAYGVELHYMREADFKKEEDNVVCHSCTQTWLISQAC